MTPASGVIATDVVAVDTPHLGNKKAPHECGAFFVIWR